jgi:uncharacterized protein (TIGR02722 family)
MFRRMTVIVSLLLLAACATSVKRLDVEEVKDVSGRWNDTDSQMVAEAMIQDCLAHPWVDQFRRVHPGKQPVLIVGTIANRSTEHINTQTFTKDLERAIINSGEATFVASSREREQLRSERDAQAGYTAEATRSFHGEESGADYMLIGTLNSIVDKEGRRSVVFYQVDLELVDMRTNRKVWIGDKKIKKYVKRAGATL